MNVKTKRNLHNFDFPNIQKVEINNTLMDIPELTEENFLTLVDDYNKLIKWFNDAVATFSKEIQDLKSR